MKDNYKACLKISLAYEGGWADHPKDPGGATMNGITLATFRQFKPGATKTELRNISDEMVQKIYRTGYWNPINGDYLFDGVDLAVNDFGINSGVSRAAKYFQAVVGVAQDGAIGDKTLKAMFNMDPVLIVQKICAKRLGFVTGLKTFATFGKGWSKRIAGIEASGVKMALAAKGKTSEEVGDALSEMSIAAMDKSLLQDKSAKATAGGGAVAGAGDTYMSGDINLWLIAGIAAAAVLIVIAIKSRSNINKERSDAYFDAAIAE